MRKQKDICKEIGNITQAHASKLCLRGLELVNEKDEYKNVEKRYNLRGGITAAGCYTSPPG